MLSPPTTENKNSLRVKFTVSFRVRVRLWVVVRLRFFKSVFEILFFTWRFSCCDQTLSASSIFLIDNSINLSTNVDKLIKNF